MNERNKFDWIFDVNSKCIKNFDNSIVVYLKRIKDKDSKLEHLEIEVKDSKMKQSEIKDGDRADSDIIAKSKLELLYIDKGLYNLRNFGVILQRSDIHKIKSEIEKNYRTLKINDADTAVIEEDLFNDLLRLVCEYIVASQIELRNNEFYDVEVKEFARIFELSDFKDVDLKKFRKELDQKQFVKANKNRTDLLVRTGTKQEPKRVIAIVERNVKNIIDEIKNDIGDVKEDTNEE